MRTENIEIDNLDVGLRIRRLREKAGLSQDELAYLIGISFQQIQKYEKGKNQVSLKRLFQITEVFNTAPSSILEDIESQIGIKIPSRQAVHSLTPVLNNDEKKILKFFRQLKGSKLRRSIFLQLQAFRNLEKNKYK